MRFFNRVFGRVFGRERRYDDVSVSIRAALGAGRTRIARELLFESVVLGLMGGVLSIGVAYGGLRLLVGLGPTNLPRLSEVTLDGGSLAFTLTLSVFSGLFFGSIPAFKYARSNSPTALMGANRTAGASRARNRLRNVLVVAQVAMALVLLISALLMIRTFAVLRSVEPGFTDAAHVQTMRIWIPELLVADSQMVTRIQNSLVDKLAAIPGVTSVGFAGDVPMDGIDPNWDQILVDGKSYVGGEPPMRLYNYVSPGYFQTMGTRLVAGREFTWDDIYGLRSNLIVSENFAREQWGSSSAAIGKRVRQFQKQPWQQVVGVVEDVRQHGVDEKAPAIIYWPVMINDPYSRTPGIAAARSVTFVLRSDQAGSRTLLAKCSEPCGR